MVSNTSYKPPNDKKMKICSDVFTLVPFVRQFVTIFFLNIDFKSLSTSCSIQMDYHIPYVETYPTYRK